MVVIQIGAIIGTLIGMAIVSSIVRGVGLGTKTVILGQLALAAGGGYLLLNAGHIGQYVFATMVSLVVAVRVLMLVYMYYMSRKVLDGSMGEEAQWAGEIVKSGDQEFINAIQGLDGMDMKEIGIMAESKEELREMTLDEVRDDE